MLRCMRLTFPGEWALEFPQGGLDAGESAEDAAERELVEETGHRVLSLRRLGVLQEAAGFVTSRVHVFSADVARVGAPRPEPLEAQNEVVELPAADVRSALVAGHIVDASSVAALGLIYLKEVRREEQRERGALEIDQFGNVVASAWCESVVLPYLRPVSDVDTGTGRTARRSPARQRPAGARVVCRTRRRGRCST